jgi:hypothetical protein
MIGTQVGAWVLQKLLGGWNGQGLVRWLRHDARAVGAGGLRAA